MRTLTLTLLFIFSHTISKGQICSFSWPGENLQPDTITNYLFLNYSLLVSKIPDTHPQSNFSFKADDFHLTWMPVYQTNIKSFISNSVKGLKDAVSIDTLQIKLLDYEYSVLLIEFNKEYGLIMYRDVLGEQDIFYGMVYKKNKIKSTLRFISMNFGDKQY